MKLKLKNPKNLRNRGFALVVTLSLMILLTVIAVGLLTLSSISLRSAGQNNSMAVARANAKLALMLAIGDLQKAAGPDKAITAPSDIIAANPQKANLTGVWDSWDFDVKSTSLDYAAPKTRKSAANVPGFKGWLVSDASVSDTAERDYPTSGFSKEKVELVGRGSLGSDAQDTDKAWAGKVAVMQGGKKTGNYAWHISDESVKARINTYRDGAIGQTLSERRSLLAGHRADVTVMHDAKSKSLDFLPDDNKNYADAVASISKIVDLNQVELYAKSPAIKSFRNDVTPYSLGLLTNVREGGLKQDLTSVFEMTTNGTNGTTGLPSAFNGKKLYQTGIFSSGTAVTGQSDPYWSTLAGYYMSYKDLVSAEGSPKLQKAVIQEIQGPAAGQSANMVQPTQFYPAPVIEKVELLFSMIVRDKHNQWAGSVPQDYLLHMLYTPIITIHNPYNVSLQFDKMTVGISGVPIGFDFKVNGASRGAMTPLSALFVGSAKNKEFWLELGDWASTTATAPAAPIVMKPGQTMLFSPYIVSEPFNVRGNEASYFDYAGGRTGSKEAPLKSKRGYNGANIGFDLDWLAGNVFGVNKADKISVEFKSMAPSTVAPFNVSATLTNKNLTRSIGGLSFNYGGQSVLDKVLAGTFKFPKTDGVTAQSMYVPNTMALGDISTATVRAFALFSAYARTANGGVDNTGHRQATPAPSVAMADGRMAGNPFLHNNPARSLIVSDLSREKPAWQSHELNIISLTGSADDAFTISADFRTNGLINYKQVANRSIKSGSFLEIPSGPLQAISDFRRSNVLSSPYLPAFVQPIGNSYASPLMATNTVSQSGILSYPFLDQSFLANHMLYDGSYFSTFAPFGTTSLVDGFTKFMEENKPLRTQLFQGYLPSGTSVDSAKSQLFSGTKPTVNAYKLAAQYQMVKGAFNVNSTRVQAWKAMLSSMKGTSLLTLWAKNSTLANPQQSEETPIPSMTLYNGGNIKKAINATGIDDPISNEWNGYREFSDTEIEKLATKIVEQVRLRGPFQSMSEFVNRRLGTDSDLTRMGALQNAIDESQLNDTMYADGRVTVRVNDSDVANANLYGFKTPRAATGNPAAGAPGWLSQGDVLKILEPAATVRSDTFVVRACGEATDATGKVIASAYAEAVVQRIPEYVNPADPIAAKVPNPNKPNNSGDPIVASPENIAFGRRFVLVSFRWLAANEI